MSQLTSGDAVMHHSQICESITFVIVHLYPPVLEEGTAPARDPKQRIPPATPSPAWRLALVNKRWRVCPSTSTPQSKKMRPLRVISLSRAASFFGRTLGLDLRLGLPRRAPRPRQACSPATTVTVRPSKADYSPSSAAANLESPLLHGEFAGDYADSARGHGRGNPLDALNLAYLFFHVSSAPSAASSFLRPLSPPTRRLYLSLPTPPTPPVLEKLRTLTPIRARTHRLFDALALALRARMSPRISLPFHESTAAAAAHEIPEETKTSTRFHGLRSGGNFDLSSSFSPFLPVMEGLDVDSELPARITNLMITNSPPSESEAFEIVDLIQVRRKAIALLNSEIEPLVVRRDALDRTTRALGLILSAARTLPFDVLSQIFRQAADLIGHPWILALVSRKWRAIALACPELWASIDIDNSATNPRLRPSDYPLGKLRTLLERSGNYPLSIRFCTVARSFDQPLTSPHADRVFGALIGCSSRWESVYLRVTQHIFPLLAQVQGNVPILRKLALDLCLDRPVLDAFEIAPQLCAVDLIGSIRFDTSPPKVTLPWTQVIRYHCDNGLWQDQVAALERVANVRECCLTMTNWAPNEHAGILVLPKLRRLYVNRGDFLEFTAPKLEELVVEPLKMTPPPDALGNLASLVHRSASNVTTLLELLPSLVELCIQSRRIDETITLDDLVISLGRSSPWLLPRLEELMIAGYTVNPWSALVDTVESRRNAHPASSSTLRAFSLLHVLRSIPIPADDLLRLQMLRLAGLDLNVVVGTGARGAMVGVPFFNAGISNGEFWAPEST
ncbi:hypothetical protein B0H13DRAFT_2661225 [Mycena leptocephala]|nr:hypothetical protein B0H13DRAFT_2661225 [Mycena leptocephala]